MNGANEDRTAADRIVALYQHDTSRELDLQLHTHSVAAVRNYDGVEEPLGGSLGICAL
jgi:hypothetical protein